MKLTFIKACCDLGTHVDGAKYGPTTLLNRLALPYPIKEVRTLDITKSHDKKDMHKNEQAINQFNSELYDKVRQVILDNNFPLTIGGDHSIAIASALAVINEHHNLGIIWFDSHADYNTFDTTITGNIHGLPLATINGLNKELSFFHQGDYYNPKNTVIVGYRAHEENQQDELDVIKKMGVTIFTTDDIKKQGMTAIMKQALKIADNNTNGIHISYDLDVLDPLIAPGVSIPEDDGLNIEEGYQFLYSLIPYKDKITSFDLVEFNPLNDKEDKTVKIAEEIIKKFINIKGISER